MYANTLVVARWTSAPALTSRSTTSVWPLRLAAWSELTPFCTVNDVTDIHDMFPDSSHSGNRHTYVHAMFYVIITVLVAVYVQ